MKIAHLADTHIRNYKYHKEYRAVFDQIYDRLRKEKVDYIVHCGDLAHTKTQLSPEYFDLATSFLKNLADIAPTYIILGNHDGNLKNAHRQDAITPIVTALSHPQLHLLKDAGEVHARSGITFNVLSVFDEENWVKPSSDKNINIALYHGSVSWEIFIKQIKSSMMREELGTRAPLFNRTLVRQMIKASYYGISRVKKTLVVSIL